MREKGLSCLNSIQLYDLLRELPFSPTNIRDIIALLETLPLDTQRLVVGHLLFRSTNSGRAKLRNFDNVLTLATLSSTNGARFRARFYAERGKSVGATTLVGIGLHAGRNEVVRLNVTCRAILPLGLRVVTLKWFSKKGELRVFEKDGRTPVLVTVPSRGQKKHREYRTVGWKREKLENLEDLKGLAQILGVRN